MILTDSAQSFDPESRSITDLTVTLNELRVRDGQPAIKRWSKSKAELVQVISALETKLTDQLLDAVLPAARVEETQGVQLDHDAAIKYIRKNRRRRDIFVRVGTTVKHAERRDFNAADYLQVSAMQARAVVTLLVGKGTSYDGFTIELRATPEKVPPGSKHKGKLYVG